jgi:hypothetical protein
MLAPVSGYGAAVARSGRKRLPADTSTAQVGRPDGVRVVPVPLLGGGRGSAPGGDPHSAASRAPRQLHPRRPAACHLRGGGGRIRRGGALLGGHAVCRRRVHRRPAGGVGGLDGGRGARLGVVPPAVARAAAAERPAAGAACVCAAAGGGAGVATQLPRAHRHVAVGRRAVLPGQPRGGLVHGTAGAGGAGGPGHRVRAAAGGPHPEPHQPQDGAGRQSR